MKFEAMGSIWDQLAVLMFMIAAIINFVKDNVEMGMIWFALGAVIMARAYLQYRNRKKMEAAKKAQEAEEPPEEGSDN